MKATFGGIVQLYESWITRLLIVFTFFLIGAGGLGTPLSVGLIGLMLLPIIALPALQASRKTIPVLVLALAALAWASASLVWSPYERPDQVLKFWLLTPLFVLAAFSFARLDDDRARRTLGWVCAAAGLLAVYLFAEAVSGSFVSEQVKLAFEPVKDPVEVAARADLILGRGTSAFVMIVGPVALVLWLSGNAVLRGVGLGMIATAAASSIAFGITANAVSLLAAIAVGALAWRFPRDCLHYGFLLTGAVIITAPLLMGAALMIIPAPLVESLPLSWAMRIEIWRFAIEQIAQAPLMGHGLDSSRVISDLTTLRGLEFDRLPLHAHNAGLTIWLETGAVGAILFGGTLILIGRIFAGRFVQPLHAAAIAYVFTAFFVTVSLGSGIWQEWLHASLAFALGVTALIRRENGA